MRRINVFVLLFVARPDRRLGLVVTNKLDQARPRPQGRGRTDLPGHADQPGRRGQRRGHRTLDRDHPRADRQARRRRARGRPPRRRPRSRSACPTSPTPSGRSTRSARRRSSIFYDWEPNLIGREKAIGGRPGTGTAARRCRRSRTKNGKPRGARRPAREPAADLLRRLPDAPTPRSSWPPNRSPSPTAPTARPAARATTSSATKSAETSETAQADRRPRVRQKGPLRQADRREAPAERRACSRSRRARSSSRN